MTDILYVLISIVCAVMIEILLNRTLRLKGRDESDKAFAVFLVAAFIFCLIDAVWGLGSSGTVAMSDGLLRALTFTLVLACTSVAFLWSMYVDLFFSTRSRLFGCLGAIIFAAQGILLVVNIWDSFLFDFRNGEFIPGSCRILMYAAFILYYCYSGIRILIRLFGLRGRYGRNRCLAVIFCSLLPVGLGLLKLIYPLAPFNAIGIMMAAVVVYIFNISSEYEHLITFENRITKMASRHNRDTVMAIAQLFKSMAVVDLKVGRCRVLKETPEGEEQVGPDNQAPVYLAGLVEDNVVEEHLNAMQEFVRLDTLNTRMAGKSTISHEFIDKKDGWCRAYFIKINEDENHLPDEVIFAVEDIDDEKLAELEHNKSVEGENAIYHEMLLVQSDGMIVTDMDNKIILMNDSAGRMFGVRNPREPEYSIRELVGRCESEEKDKILDMLVALKAIGGRRSYEFTIDLGESKISVMAISYVTSLKQGNMKVMITSLTDISAKKSLERALTAMSETDALTGISNRGGGEAKIMKMLNEGVPGMFALMDVDKFKSVNDTFGHGVGDKVLIEVAACLVRSFRDVDIVMRLGGDEFAVYARGIVKPDVARACLERLYQEAEKIDVEELKAAGHRITLSLGAVICGKHQVQTFDELYHQADNAMYVSKRGGGNHYELTV